MKLPLKKEIERRLFSIYSIFATLPFHFRKNQIDPPKIVGHSQWLDHVSAEFNKPGMKVLEVGSRVVTGANLRNRFSEADYVGFDFYEGPNVDVSGDAHNLSNYFEENSFDLVFSSAVFEHLHMPWVAAEEIVKVTKPGGQIFIETHFSFRSHERPWNFFQFSDMGLRCLFNKRLGVEIIEAGMSNPMGGYFERRADQYLRFRPIRELYCHSGILCKKIESVDDFDWRRCELDDIVENTRYPKPKS